MINEEIVDGLETSLDDLHMILYGALQSKISFTQLNDEFDLYPHTLGTELDSEIYLELKKDVIQI